MYAQASVEITPHERLFAPANRPERWPLAAPFTYKGLRDIRDPAVLMTLIENDGIGSSDDSEATETSDDDSEAAETASDGDDDAEVRSAGISHPVIYSRNCDAPQSPLAYD